jgi:hypothetical protein
MTCQWCGDEHDVGKLCQRAQRGMTRRTFCFLFGTGVGALSLGFVPSLPTPKTVARLTGEDVARMLLAPADMIMTQTSVVFKFDFDDLVPKPISEKLSSGFWYPS